MMNRTKLFLFFIFLFMMPLTTAQSVFFSENFEYSTAYTSNGWDFYTNGGCGAELDHPLNSTLDGLAYGYNRTNPCGFGHQISIRQDLNINATNTVSFSYDWTLLNDTVNSNIPFVFDVKKSQASGEKIIFNHKQGASFETACGSQVGTCNTCVISIPSGFPITVFSQIVLDLNDKTFTWAVNGSTGNCTDINYGELNVSAIALTTGVDVADLLQTYTDDIEVTGTGALLFDTNVPCTSSDECISDKCSRGVCMKKLFRENCASNVECLSGSCLNGFCTKESLSQGVDATKNELFGDDAKTNNLIALFFMILIPALVILWARSGFGAIAAVAIHFGMAFLFVFIGWLSIFILLGEIIAGLIIIILVFMLSGGSN